MRGLAQILGAMLLATFSAAASAADQQPICADRPGKANPTCTVPAGMVQIETGLADWVHDRSGAVTTDALALGATAFKYGLNSRWNIELDVAPYNSLRVAGGGMRQFDSSFGDLVLRSKYRFTDGNGVQVAMNPALKIPTASVPVGNRKWEGGIAFPIDYSMPHSQFGITLGPEIDWLADLDGGGHHLAMAQVVGIGWQATPKLNLSAELWGQWNWDPTGTVRQSTADAAIAYLVNNDVQLDAGANFGLNRQTPDVELYTGVSVRF
jgi:hypothetical protein